MDFTIRRCSDITISWIQTAGTAKQLMRREIAVSAATAIAGQTEWEKQGENIWNRLQSSKIKCPGFLNLPGTEGLTERAELRNEEDQNEALHRRWKVIRGKPLSRGTEGAAIREEFRSDRFTMKVEIAAALQEEDRGSLRRRILGEVEDLTPEAETFHETVVAAVIRGQDKI